MIVGNGALSADAGLLAPGPTGIAMSSQAAEWLRHADPASADEQNWTLFVARYEQFTDVLCAAAKNGCTDDLENEFAALRAWFMRNYYNHADRLRGCFEGLREPSQGGNGDASVVPMDPFESIFLPRTLRELLAHDHGNLISLVSSVSQAIYLCA